MNEIGASGPASRCGTVSASEETRAQHQAWLKAGSPAIEAKAAAAEMERS
jgi:hypothetical protein